MKLTQNPIVIPFTLGLLVWSSPLATGAPAQPSSVIIHRCDQPFSVRLRHLGRRNDGLPVDAGGRPHFAKNGQGGAGVTGLNVKIAEFVDWTPVLTLAVGEQNKAELLNLLLRDADGTSHQFKFNLRGLTPGSSQKVAAEYGAALAEPQIVEKPGDTPGLEGVVSYLVIGDWSGSAVDVVLSGIELVPPTETLLPNGPKLRERRPRKRTRLAKWPRRRRTPAASSWKPAHHIRRTVLKCGTYVP